MTPDYPLSSAQDVFLFADRFMFKHSWLNIAALVELRSAVDPGVMLQAVELAMMRTPSARIRLHRTDKKTVRQYYSEKAPEGVELLDLSALTDAEFDLLAEKWAQTPFPNKLMDTQLYRIKLVRRAEEHYALYICVCHIAFDSYALMSMLEYLFRVYTALLEGTPIPREMGSPIPMYESEITYRNSPAYEEDRAFWKSKSDPSDEPMFTSLYGKDGKFNIKGKRAGKASLVPFKTATFHENLRIPADLVEKINALAAQWRISAQCFYQMALNAYLGALCETDDVTIISTLARRATLVQKRGGGTNTDNITVRTKFPHESTPFEEACHLLSNELNACYRHAAFSYTDMDALRRESYGTTPLMVYSGVYFCYQPYFIPGTMKLDFTFRRLNNGNAATPLYMTILMSDDSGDLTVNYEVAKAYYSREQILKLHEFLLGFLTSAVDAPGKTVAELAKENL